MEWICQQAPPFLLPRWYNVLAWVAACAIITGTLATKVCVYVCVRACVRACVCHSLTHCVRAVLCALQRTPCVYVSRMRRLHD